LAIEFSRNPALRMQLQQMMAERMRAAAGPTSPMLTEGEGGAGHEAGEELPMSAPRTPVEAPTTPEGEIGLRGVRGR